MIERLSKRLYEFNIRCNSSIDHVYYYPFPDVSAGWIKTNPSRDLPPMHNPYHLTKVIIPSHEATSNAPSQRPVIQYERPNPRYGEKDMSPSYVQNA